jgi:hypothetical protein
MKSNSPISPHRYPGAQPFSTAQEAIFFGREQDITNLHRFVKLESLVVLYSKSGLGKSSLINAGLIPLVVAEGVYTPLSIRFGAYQKTMSQAQMPDSLMRQAVAPNGSRDTFLDKLLEHEATLWHDLKEAQIESNGQKKLMLIFDQFEELFTYPPEAINRFKEELAEALYAKLPQRYRAELEKQIEKGTCTLTDTEFELLQESFIVRILIAIRSDRLSLMNELSDFLPTVLKNLFELTPLSKEGAEAAIVKPARHTETQFSTPPFDYTPQAVQKILHFLTDNETERIESTQLQIICQTVEEKVKTAGQMITAEDLGDLSTIIENYYDEKICAIPNPVDQLAARRLIEENLIFEEEERRLSLYEGVVLKFVNPEILKQLVDSHLLRAEPTLQGGLTYELSHDSMVRPVLKAKQKRKEEEARAERQRQRHIEEAEKERERRERAAELERERRRRTRSQLIAVVMTALAILSCFTLVYAWRKKQQTEESLAKLEMETQRKIDLQSQLLMQDAYAFMQAEEWDFALKKLNQIKAISSDAAMLSRVNEYIHDCQSKIGQ